MSKSSVVTDTSKYKAGIKTGIEGWEQYVDPSTGRAYFRNHSKGISSWGLPLRDVLNNKGVSGPTGEDDWMCYVDTETQKRFYQSKRSNKVQWKVPHIYSTTIGKLEYFTDEFAEKQRKNREKMMSKKVTSRQETELLQKVLQRVTIRDVLDNSVICAAFHRFLVSVFAEENLLFYGAIQVFEKGKFHGMDVFGITNNKSSQEDEGAESLQNQLTQTRASIRIGVPLKKTSLKNEASIVYEKFLKPNSELWVCVNQKTAKRVKERIDDATDEADVRGVFAEAEQEVLENLTNDLLPRFLRAAMGGADESEQTDFRSDELLQLAITSLLGEDHTGRRIE